MEPLEKAFAEAADGHVDLETILRETGQALHHYARVLAAGPEAAEDAVQDLLVALLRQGARLRAVEHPRAWLFTVLRRKARGLRLRERSLAPALAGSVEGDPTDRLALQEALALLSPREQEIVLLHHWSGLTFAELAQVLGVARGTALSTYHRAIQRLRAQLGVEARGADDEQRATRRDEPGAALPSAQDRPAHV